MATQPYQLPDIGMAAARLAQRGAGAVGRGLGAAGRWAFRHTPVGDLIGDEPDTLPTLRTGVSSLTPQAPPRPEPLSIESHAGRLMDSQQSSNDPMDQAVSRFTRGNPETSRQVLAGGDFRSMQPDWGTDVSASQLAIDDDARSDIFERHARRMREIQADEGLRGDPMEDAIRRQEQNLQYERNLPHGSRPRMAVNFSGGRDLMDIEPEPVGGPTIGERTGALSAIELAQARLNPKDTAEGALGMGRGRLVEELLSLKAELDAEVRAGRRTPQDAQRLLSESFAQTQQLVEMLKGGFPRTDDLMANPGVMPENRRLPQ